MRRLYTLYYTAQKAFPKKFKALILGLGLYSSQASALPSYFEFGGGFAIPSYTPRLFSDTESPIAKWSADLTYGVQLQNNLRNTLLFQFAISAKYLGFNIGSDQYNALSIYPMLRVEFWKLGLGVGYAPLQWKALPAQTQVTSLSQNTGVASLLYEVYFLFPITPEIDFSLRGTYTQFLVNAVSVTPIIHYGMFFRLNFGSGSSKEDRKISKGWRYPYGKSKK